MKNIKFLVITMIISLLASFMPLASEAQTVRLKDISHVKGVRDNQIVGYGIVVGLPKTGDNSRSTQITEKLLLMNLGTVISQDNYIQKGCSAAVIVTATVPPFAKDPKKYKKNFISKRFVSIVIPYIIISFITYLFLMNNNLTSGPIFKSIVKFALPVLLALFLQALYGAVDLLIVGHFGSTADVAYEAQSSMDTASKTANDFFIIFDCIFQTIQFF